MWEGVAKHLCILYDIIYVQNYNSDGGYASTEIKLHVIWTFKPSGY